MRKTKGFLALIMLIIVLYNQGGYFFIYQKLRSDARSEMKSFLQNGSYSTTDLIAFAVKETSEFEWEDNSEFEVDGHMYDVVYAENDSVYVIMDEKEDRLISSFIKNKKITDEQDKPFCLWAKKYKERIKTDIKKLHYISQSFLLQPAPYYYMEYVVYSNPDFPPPKV